MLLDISALASIPLPDPAKVETLYAGARHGRKVVVLDDDPTGVQTVHGVSVYTDWEVESIRRGFAEEGGIFYILTNSRGMPADEAARVNTLIGERVCHASRESGKDFILISRSDSTLRGHFPAETEALRAAVEANSGKRFHGEIICPFFAEGGRFTLDDIHYVKIGGELVPAGQTEFARDPTFGYKSSHMGEYVEEKTGGAYKKEDCVYIPLAMLRSLDTDGVTALLLSASGFFKIIVNAADYADLKVFAAAYCRALAAGREFIFRSAAAVPKTLGGIPDKPLLTREELVRVGDAAGGIVVVGSHVNRTTRQLEALLSLGGSIAPIEFDQHLAAVDGGLEGESSRVAAAADTAVRSGKTAVIYTRRERYDVPGGDAAAQLKAAVRISDAVTASVAGLTVRPAFIIAKGGITSSDIGTKALQVRRAEVMGQVKPGIPVWRTGPESLFPGMPYVIFPGNVGEDGTLRDIVEMLVN